MNKKEAANATEKRNRLKLPYFYGEESEKFEFYRIPKVLFENEEMKKLSGDAKILYGLMLDRTSLSQTNTDKYTDKNNRVYIIYPMEKIQDDLGCGNQKAAKICKELIQIGLIEKKRQGLGKPDIIYVKDFSGVLLESHVQKCENHTTGRVKITRQDVLKSHTNKTNKNKTNNNHTESINQSTNAREITKEDTRLEEIICYFVQTFGVSPTQNFVNSLRDVLEAGMLFGTARQAVDDAAKRKPKHPSAYAAKLLCDYAHRGGAPMLSIANQQSHKYDPMPQWEQEWLEEFRTLSAQAQNGGQSWQLSTSASG